MKKIIMICMVLVFVFTFAHAEEAKKKERDVSIWEMIRTKIEEITPQKKPTVTTAVGGVRGAKNEAGEDLYWKGEEVNPKVSEQELAKFVEALKTAEAGELDAARLLFEGFVVEFPESELKPDAFLALKSMDKATDANVEN